MAKYGCGDGRKWFQVEHKKKHIEEVLNNIEEESDFFFSKTSLHEKWFTRLRNMRWRDLMDRKMRAVEKYLNFGMCCVSAC